MPSEVSPVWAESFEHGILEQHVASILPGAAYHSLRTFVKTANTHIQLTLHIWWPFHGFFSSASAGVEIALIAKIVVVPLLLLFRAVQSSCPCTVRDMVRRDGGSTSPPPPPPRAPPPPPRSTPPRSAPRTGMVHETTDWVALRQDGVERWYVLHLSSTSSQEHDHAHWWCILYRRHAPSGLVTRQDPTREATPCCDNSTALTSREPVTEKGHRGRYNG
jgi:hypothetical protein